MSTPPDLPPQAAAANNIDAHIQPTMTAPASGRLSVLAVSPDGVGFTIGPLFSTAAIEKLRSMIDATPGWITLRVVGAMSKAEFEHDHLRK